MKLNVFKLFIISIDSRGYISLTPDPSHPLEALSPASMVLLFLFLFLLLLDPNKAQPLDKLQEDQAMKTLGRTSDVQAYRMIMMLRYMKLLIRFALSEGEQATNLSPALPPYPTPQHRFRQGSTVSWRPVPRWKDRENKSKNRMRAYFRAG